MNYPLNINNLYAICPTTAILCEGRLAGNRSNAPLGNLVRTAGEIRALRLRVLAEPLTAVLTLTLAFVDPLLWELGWLTYPLFAMLLRRAGVTGG
jgi:hypothetical protein